MVNEHNKLVIAVAEVQSQMAQVKVKLKVISVTSNDAQWQQKLVVIVTSDESISIRNIDKVSFPSFFEVYAPHLIVIDGLRKRTTPFYDKLLVSMTMRSCFGKMIDIWKILGQNITLANTQFNLGTRFPSVFTSLPDSAKQNGFNVNPLKTTSKILFTLPRAYLVWPCLEVNPHDKA